MPRWLGRKQNNQGLFCLVGLVGNNTTTLSIGCLLWPWLVSFASGGSAPPGAGTPPILYFPAVAVRQIIILFFLWRKALLLYLIKILTLFFSFLLFIFS